MTDTTRTPDGSATAPGPGTASLPPLPDFEHCELWPLMLRWQKATEGNPKVAAAEQVEDKLGRMMHAYAVEAMERVTARPAPDDIATDVVQMFCDMDDRSSPEDAPEMMLVTGPELHNFVLTALERAAARQGGAL